MKLVSLLVAVILQSSCAMPTGNAKIPIVPAPDYPKLTQQQDDRFFTKLPQIYQILGKRDKMCRGYAKRLLDLISAHNSD